MTITEISRSTGCIPLMGTVQSSCSDAPLYLGSVGPPDHRHFHNWQKLAAGSLKLSFGLKPSRVLLSLHHFGTFLSQTVHAIL